MGWVSGQPVFVMMSLAAALVVAHAAAANENGTDAVGATLHIACKNGHTDAVRLLLDGGAEVDLPAQDGVTPLVIACMNGHVEVTRLLLEKGAAVDQAMEDGRTPLFIACDKGHVEAARLLVAKGAEVDRAMNDGRTPLYAACGNGHVGAARLLLNNGADINQAKNTYGVPVLDIAKRQGHNAVVALLKERTPSLWSRVRSGLW